MPPLVVAFAALAAKSLFLAHVVLFAVTTGLNFAIGAIAKLFVGSPKAPTFSQDAFSNQVSLRQPISPWQIIYGRARVGGAITYIEQTGANKEYVHVIYTVAGHEVEDIPKLYIEGVEVPVDGSGDATGRYAGYVHWEKKLGTAAQTAYATLVSASASLWTNDHRQRGRANCYVRFKISADIFPSGVPINAVTFDVKGKKLYDTRSSTTAYSENSALAERDYLCDTSYGVGVLSTEIDVTVCNEAANICDENVSLAAGGTEDRYTTNGAFYTTQTPAQVIPRLNSAMAGRLVYTAGKFGIYAGSYRTPTITLTQADLRKSLRGVKTRRSRRELFNGVKGVFIDPNNDWKVTDFPAFSKASYLAEDSGYNTVQEQGKWITATAYVVGDAVMHNRAGYICTVNHTSNATYEPGVGASWDDRWDLLTERIWKDSQLPFTISSPTAMRLAKIDLERNRRQISVPFPAKLTGYSNQPPDTVQLTLSRYSWTAKTFEVVNCQFAQEEDKDGAPILGVDLHLEETDANVFAWATTEELARTAPAAMIVPTPEVVAAPTAMTLTSGTTTVLTRVDGVKISRIKAAWTAPADQAVLAGGSQEVQYKKNADSVWKDTIPVDGAATETYILDVDDGVSYDVRVRGVSTFGVASAWLTVTGHTVTGVTSNFTGNVDGDTAADVKTGASRARTALDTNSRLSAVTRNNMVDVTGLFSGLSITQDGTTTNILVSASTLQVGGTTVSYNSGSVNPGSYGLKKIYVDDETFAGGAVTYLSTTSATTLVAARGRLFIGQITTASGGGTTGTPGGSGCTKKGSYLEPLGGSLEVVEQEWSEWVEVIAVDGTTLHCVPQHPLYTDRGKVAAIDLLLGEEVVTKEGMVRIRTVRAYHEAGVKLVATVPGGQMYWAASTDGGNAFLSHNAKAD